MQFALQHASAILAQGYALAVYASTKMNKSVYQKSVFGLFKHSCFMHKLVHNINLTYVKWAWMYVHQLWPYTAASHYTNSPG